MVKPGAVPAAEFFLQEFRFELFTRGDLLTTLRAYLDRGLTKHDTPLIDDADPAGADPATSRLGGGRSVR